VNFKHVIWDWNGTLVDDTWLFVDIMNGVLKNRNLPPITLQDYRDVFDFPVKDYYTKLGFNFDEEPFESSGLDFIKIYNRRKFEPKLFEDTLTTLNGLKKLGYTHSILSAQNTTTLQQSVKHYNLHNIFDYINGLDDYYAIGKIEQGKHLIQNLNYNKDEIIMIGDTEHDYDVSHAIGIQCFLIDRGHNSTERLRTKQDNIFSSFAKVIEQLS